MNSEYDNLDNRQVGVIIYGGTFDSIGIHFKTVNSATS